MFEQITTADSARRANKLSFALSFTVQSTLVAAALALPLMHVSRIAPPVYDIFFFPRPIGSQAPVQQAPARQSAASAVATLQSERVYRPFQQPSTIPSHVAMGPDLPGAPWYDIAANTGGGGGIDIPGLPDLDARPLPLPPPPQPQHRASQPASQPAQVEIGGKVQASKLIHGPRPVYPPLAKQARISGMVQLAARISPDGRIRDLRVTSGHPMLVQAALEAVKHWVYEPTLLNGKPVEVITDIEVNFVLN